MVTLNMESSIPTRVIESNCGDEQTIDSQTLPPQHTNTTQFAFCVCKRVSGLPIVSPTPKIMN